MTLLESLSNAFQASFLSERMVVAAIECLTRQAASDHSGRTARKTLDLALQGDRKALTSILRKLLPFSSLYSKEELHRKRKWPRSLFSSLGPPDFVIKNTGRDICLWSAVHISTIEQQEIFQIKAKGKIVVASANQMKQLEAEQNLERLEKLGQDFSNRKDMRKNTRQNISKRRYQRNRNFIYKAKLGKPCADCKLSFHPSAMQFDHIPGSKKAFSLSKMPSAGSLDLVQKEIAKCEIVCCNCHRLRTHFRNLTKRKNRSYPAREKLQDEVGRFKEENPCGVCSGFFKRWQLDFHHTYHETKVASISSLIANSASKEEIWQEIAKCRLLCANCHAIETAIEADHLRHIRNGDTDGTSN